MSRAEKPKGMSFEEHIDWEINRSPSWDDLPVTSRSTLLRIFRDVDPIEVLERGRSA